MAILEVAQLEKSFGGTRVLQDISFSLEEGQALSIIGSSGSGKTTLLRTISGLVKAKSGSITYNNEQLLGKPINAILAAGIAQVPEGRRVFPDMTVLENPITLKSALAKNQLASLDALAEELASQVNA